MHPVSAAAWLVQALFPGVLGWALLVVWLRRDGRLQSRGVEASAPGFRGCAARARALSGCARMGAAGCVAASGWPGVVAGEHVRVHPVSVAARLVQALFSGVLGWVLLVVWLRQDGWA
ncbi:hypothetical protein GCM10010988_16420 [Cnuibacter physcomitrellae]|nr:hypothetical protein GCM10010988_16420 [Cnuibacter physcomitrellae]